VTPGMSTVATLGNRAAASVWLNCASVWQAPTSAGCSKTPSPIQVDEFREFMVATAKKVIIGGWGVVAVAVNLVLG